MLARELLDKCPFFDRTSGKMFSKWRATWDRVFVWQPTASDRVGSIIIPDTVRDWHKPQIGVIVSVGAGWYDDKKFHPMFLRPTWTVIFDIRVPWRLQLSDKSGDPHGIVYMGEQDVRAIVDPDQDIDVIGDLICKGNFMRRACRLGGLG